MGQRIKSEETSDGKTQVTLFLMSGMMEFARLSGDMVQFHTLGLDLSGSLTATGGVGAVLSSTNFAMDFKQRDSINYLYDGNGNTISACDDKGEISAKLIYAPFGEIIEHTNVVPFSFSTKSNDSSGLFYYGYRLYSPDLGRWLSRDPIGENGGSPLYIFGNNSPINHYDIVGLSMADCANVLAASASNSAVMHLQIDYVKNEWLGLGSPAYCLTGISCTECCEGGHRGGYYPIPGTIELCAANKIDGNRSESAIQQTLVHELTHAQDSCRSITFWCESCMINEKRAYWIAFQCGNNTDCTTAAWASCKDRITCWLKSKEDYINIGNPETIPR